MHANRLIHTCFWGFMGALAAAPLAAAFEAPKEIPSGEVVSESVLSGPLYRIAPSVRADGFAQQYTIKTTGFGNLHASSDYMLPERIREVQALAVLEDLHRHEAFGSALKEAAKKPFLVGRDLVTKPKETLSGAGQGLKKATKKAVGWLSGDRRERADSEDSAFSEAIGFSRTKRKLAAQLGVDVYSTNAKLQDEMDQVCWATVTGGISVSAMLAALALPPIIDIARHTTSFTGGLNNLLVTQSGGDLYRMNREILNGMGFPPSQTEPFLDNEHASPRHKTFIVAAMKDLEGVEGLDILIAHGRALRSEDDALRLQRTVELARGHHRHVAPLRRIVDVGGEIVLVTTRGQVVATLPADRLLWTAYTEQLAKSLEKQRDAEPEVDEKHLWITGVFSDEARNQLRDRDIVLHDQASDTLEPPSQQARYSATWE